MNSNSNDQKDENDQKHPIEESDRTIIIVTGANQGIGRSISKHLSNLKNPINEEYVYQTVLICRNEAKGIKTQNDLQKETGNKNIFLIICDISSYKDIKNIFFKQITSIIQSKKTKCNIILINNAAQCPKVKSINKNGLETQFATNVLGYHFMIRSIFGHLITNDKGIGNINDMNVLNTYINFKSSRIVNIASNWAGDLNINDLQFNKRKYNNDTAYRQSKQCDRMLNYIWSNKLKRYGVLVNCCHPGDPCTTLSKALGYNLYSSTDCSICYSPIYLAINDKVITTGGWYESDCKLRKCKFTQNEKLCNELFNVCDTYCTV